MEILPALQKKIPIIAFEIFSDEAVQYVLENFSLVFPFSHRSKFYALVEYEILNGISQLKIAEFLKSFDIDDILFANSSDEAGYYWRFRKEISGSLQKYFPQKYDIAIMPSKIPEFVSAVEKLLYETKKNIKIIWFGHAGDGNLHLNILKPGCFTQAEFLNFCDMINDDIYKIVEEFQGSVSAEHGIGLLKKRFLQNTRSSEEIILMKNIKNIFDPNNIMNSGKLI